MKITKRRGNIVLYDDEKLINSILKANAETSEDLTPRAAAYLSDVVIGRLAKAYDIITTEQIRKGVYEALRENGFVMTAERYKEYVKEQQ